MLHRNTLIAICAIFCVFAIGAGVVVATMSKRSALIAQPASAEATVPATSIAAEPTPSAAEPTMANTPVPTNDQNTALDPAAPTAASQPAPTSPAPTEPPPPAAAATPAGSTAAYIEYTVQKGDLLNNIAKKYNVTTKDILAINDISNADSLTIGQVLRIPKVSG